MSNIRRGKPRPINKPGISLGSNDDDDNSSSNQSEQRDHTPSKPITKPKSNLGNNNDNDSLSSKPSNKPKPTAGSKPGGNVNENDVEVEDLTGEDTQTKNPNRNKNRKPGIGSAGGNDDDDDDVGGQGEKDEQSGQPGKNRGKGQEGHDESEPDEEQSGQGSVPQRKPKPRLQRPQGQAIDIGGSDASPANQGTSGTSKNQGNQPNEVGDEEIDGREEVFDGAIGGEGDQNLERIRDYWRRPRRYKPEEIAEELEEVDTKMQESAKLRRNGVLVTSKQEAELIRAATEEIARSKFPDYAKAGAKITFKVLVLAGSIAMIVLAPPSAAAGVPAIIYLVKDVATGIYKTAEAISGIAGIAQGLGKLTPQQQEGMKRLKALTGTEYQGAEANAEALEAYKRFRVAAAENMKEKKYKKNQVVPM